MRSANARARPASSRWTCAAARASSRAPSFTGYDALQGESSIVALLRDGAEVPALHTGEQGEVVLAHTPFYAESGGQVGDTGVLVAAAAPCSPWPTRRSAATPSRTSAT